MPRPKRDKAEMLPFTGKKDLPQCEVKKKLLKNGQEVEVMVRPGPMRYAVRGNKLLGFYRKQVGVSRKLIRVFHPKNKLDESFRAALRVKEIPGA